LAARHQVTFFLILMKQAAAHHFVLVERRKNLDTLARLGMTVSDAKERVMGLTPEDYLSGPSPDDKHQGDEVWTFGLGLEEQDVYVKVCVLGEPLLCTCISFHFAEKPFFYPLRASTE